MLDWLGGNSSTWRATATPGDPRVPMCCHRLAEFGGATSVQGSSVAQMRDAVTATIHSVRASQSVGSDASWILAGHSMGGKVAALSPVRQPTDRRLAGLARLVLISASPPSVEPNEDAKRAELLRILGTESLDHPDLRPRDRASALTFVRENVGDPEVASAAAHHHGALLANRRSNPRALTRKRVNVRDICPSRSPFVSRISRPAQCSGLSSKLWRNVITAARWVASVT